ncbi:89f0d8fc-7d8d-441a-ad19-2ee4883d7fb9 [Thermothielavioides terrestris]|uniref:89f0d8fc-7d8d-441a-ad19-2ee4883d7fb9 n=1 Tax=Thermothielavioides terrestris TaxID=2587410 RepID=A0A3S5CXM3_9PEZI|nr:89f0d8fc-7d8d-441a-ad19-2ee4883d7fb9 [Thermothielavioides terrestris]
MPGDRRRELSVLLLISKAAAWQLVLVRIALPTARDCIFLELRDVGSQIVVAEGGNSLFNGLGSIWVENWRDRTGRLCRG